MINQLALKYKPKHRFKFKPMNIDFTRRRENNINSDEILKRFTIKINNQVQRTLFLMAYGKILTVYDAIVHYKISHLPRRIKDIEDFLDMKPGRTYNEVTGTANYFLYEEQKIKAIRILKGMD